jgi:endonuclease YncB( thermonuclease family)
MKTRAAALASLLVFSAAPALAAPPPRSQPERHVTIWRRHVVAPATIRVHDGDTFYTGAETIRLRGIDAPELGRPRARQATLRLARLLAEGPVTIVPRAEDVYGRTVAQVYVRGHDVAATLRREGLGTPRRRPPAG